MIARRQHAHCASRRQTLIESGAALVKGLTEPISEEEAAALGEWTELLKQSIIMTPSTGDEHTNFPTCPDRIGVHEYKASEVDNSGP